MAFVQSVSLNVAKTTSPAVMSTRRGQTTTMAVAGHSRRAMLHLAAGALAMVGVTAVRAAEDDSNFSLKELKKDVEELKYDEEVVDVGPDDREKNPTRIKKKVEVPAFRSEEKELVKEEEENYDEMVAKEKADAAKIKAKFSKK